MKTWLKKVILSMEKTIQQLQEIVADYAPLLKTIQPDDFTFKSQPQQWSKKEIIGHLVDSAQTNARRFVVAQYEDKPALLYAQDYWVKAAGYQHYPVADLICLWELLNKHICIILQNVPAGFEEKECMTNELRSIKWLAEDYNKHLLHHLHQALHLEPVTYP